MPFLTRIICVGIALKVVTPICEARNLQLYATTILKFYDIISFFKYVYIYTATDKCSVIQNFVWTALYGEFVCFIIFSSNSAISNIVYIHTFFILFIVIMKLLFNLYNKSTSFCNCSGNLNIRMPVIVFDCVNGKL